MRMLWVAALLALLGVGSSLPATADTGSHARNSDARDRAWSDEDGRSKRRRVARADITDRYEDYDTRSRRAYDGGDRDRPRYTKRRHTRHATRGKRHHRAARRAGRQVAHHRSRRGVRHAQRHRRPDRTARHHGAPPRLSGSATNGVASYYYSGHTVASGARFNPDGMTAAHRTLPFGTRVRVTHLGNGRSVNVVINDRGPFIGGRIIDLSRGAANVIGMMGQGLARVSVTILGR
jgi:rare lipoprotein A